MPLTSRRPLRATVLLATAVMLLPPHPALANAGESGSAQEGSGTEEHHEETDAAHEHEVHSEPGPGDDVFGEGLVRPVDPYVETTDEGAVGPLRVPVTPHDWVGPAPDPADVPEEWMRRLPAETVEPSTTEELMSPETGYFAALEEDGEPSPVAEGFASPDDGPEVTAEGTESPDSAAETTGPQDEEGMLGTMSAQSSSTVKSPPEPSRTLPAQLDAAPGWQYSYSCDPNDKPGMVAFADLIGNHYGYPRYYTSRRCLAGDNSQHYEGRAVDWPMDAYNSTQRQVGDAVAQWLTANNGEMARRFGIMSIIWNRKSWYIYAPGTWRDYTGPSPHTDHLHISFTWDGAMKRTSWWTGRAVTDVDHGTCRVYSGQYAPRYIGRNLSRCSTSLPKAPDSPFPVMLPWARNDYVKTAQRYLGFSGSTVDGVFGPMTLNALLDYQRSRRLYVTGVLDNQSWAHMVASSSQSVEQVTRYQGRTRYHVAANASAGTYPVGVDTVYIASGQLFPAALSGGAAAGATGSPLLLVKDDALPGPTRRELERLRPSRIVVLGGSVTIQQKVVDELRTLATARTSDAVVRVQGDDRYAVAAKVAARTYPNGARTVYVASGQGFADALAGSAVAGKARAPLLLVKSDRVPRDTRRQLSRLAPDRIVVLGGSETVEDAAFTALQSHAATVERIGGLNRYVVAVRTTKQHYSANVDTVYVANGTKFPGALAGGAVGGRSGSPVLPVKANTLPNRVRSEIERLQPRRVVVLGGTDSVSGAVADQLAALSW